MKLTLYRECDDCGRVDEREPHERADWFYRGRPHDPLFPGWVDYGAVLATSIMWECRSLCPDCALHSNRPRCLAAIALGLGRPVALGQYGRALVIRANARSRRRGHPRLGGLRWRSVSDHTRGVR